MAENPIAIRAGDETKELFNKLAEESGLANKGEFLHRALTAYQAELVKNSGRRSASLLSPAITSIEQYANRVLETLNGAAAAIDIEDMEHQNQLKTREESYEAEKRELNEQILELNRKLKDLRTENEKLKNIIKEHEGANIAQMAEQMQKLTEKIDAWTPKTRKRKPEGETEVTTEK